MIIPRRDMEEIALSAASTLLLRHQRAEQVIEYALHDARGDHAEDLVAIRNILQGVGMPHDYLD